MTHVTSSIERSGGGSRRANEAAQRARYGPVADVRVGPLPTPVPGPGQVLVRVHAAAVNPGDVFAVTGSPFPVRLATGLFRPRRPQLGHDVAGEVEAVGPGVRDLATGDRVYGEGVGSFASWCVASADRLARFPAVWSYAQAAATPMAGTTALHLFRRGLPEPGGRRLLVLGAGGGIGTFLVQLAADAGAEVVAVCSAGKRDLVLELGAAEAVDYAVADVTARRDRFDAIVDNVAVLRFAQLLPLLAPGGLLLTNSGTGTADGNALTRPLRAAVLGGLLRRPVRAVVASTRAVDLERLAALGAEGRLRPVVGGTYPLADVAGALAEVATGHARGKVVVTVRPPA